MVRNDGRTTLRTEGKRHVLDHLGRVIFHPSSPRPHFSPFLCQFQWKISKSIRKEAKRQPALPRRVSLFLRRPAAACFSLSRNELKRAKSPMLQGFSHALVHFGENKRHRSVHPDALIFTLFILRRYCRDPRPMNFAFFHTKGATGLLLTSPQRSDPGPRWGQKRANQRIIKYINSLKVILIRMCFSHFYPFKEVLFITHFHFIIQLNVPQNAKIFLKLSNFYHKFIQFIFSLMKSSNITSSFCNKTKLINS